MKKTTTREYDPQGNLVREVIVEEDSASPPVVAPAPAYQYCTCGSSGWCPLHGSAWRQWPIITCDTITVSPQTTCQAVLS